MKVGIMGAMEQEIARIKQQMLRVTKITKGGRTYYQGDLHGVEVVLVFSRWGKVAASSTATLLINLFKIDFLLFTGVAGAVARDLNIGDIVIGTSLYQHDVDARPFFPRFEIPFLKKHIFQPQEIHTSKLHTACNIFLNDLPQYINAPLLKNFLITQPKVYLGAIASGDQFISDNTQDSLRLDEGAPVLAVEMEGAAVAQICEEYIIPYAVVRVISDVADHSAHIDFVAFIEEIASLYSAGIVANFMTMFIEVTQAEEVASES